MADVSKTEIDFDKRQAILSFDDARTKIEALNRATTDACQWFYDCKHCRAVLKPKPKPGDCCDFCSYGAVPSPPIQLSGRQAGCCA